METMMSGATAPGGGSDDAAEWVPLTPDTWRFVLGKPELSLSQYKNEDGSDQHQILIMLQLTDEEYEEAKRKIKVEPGQAVNGRVKLWLPLGEKRPLGRYQGGAFVPTLLTGLLAAAFGAANKEAVTAFIAGGGCPDWSGCRTNLEAKQKLIDWLAPMENAEVWFETFIPVNKEGVPSKFAKAHKPAPVGQRPAPPEPEYQEWGANRLKELMGTSSSSKAVENREKVVTAITGEVRNDLRTYADVFGSDDAA